MCRELFGCVENQSPFLEGVMQRHPCPTSASHSQSPRLQAATLVVSHWHFEWLGKNASNALLLCKNVKFTVTTRVHHLTITYTMYVCTFMCMKLKITTYAYSILFHSVIARDKTYTCTHTHTHTLCCTQGHLHVMKYEECSVQRWLLVCLIRRYHSC